MALMNKIRALCDHDGISVTKLEDILGYTHGAIIRNSADSMKSEKIRTIANHFSVTPTYLLTDMKYCVCPICAVAFDPLDDDDIDQHHRLHNNYVKLRDKMGYLLNPSQAASKRSVAKSFLEEPNLPDEGKIFHYETLVQCDFAEHAYFNDFLIDISYSDFIKEEIRLKRYFELLNPSIIKTLSSKYNVNPDEEDIPIIELFQTDKEFMSNITDLWDLPQALRYDVYKAIRHAKRDYADKEYYTNPYANIDIQECNDYNSLNPNCKECVRGGKKHEEN